MSKKYAWYCGTENHHGSGISFTIEYSDSPDNQPDTKWGWDHCERMSDKDLIMSHEEVTPPKEWLVAGYTVYEKGKETAGYRIGYFTPVVEKSAYDAVTSELAEEIKERQKWAKTAASLSAQLVELQKERDELMFQRDFFEKSELSKIKLLYENKALIVQLAELQLQYDERGMAMRETGDMVRSLYEPKVERLECALDLAVDSMRSEGYDVLADKIERLERGDV